MSQITIAHLQHLPGPDVDTNLQLGIDACRQAKQLKPTVDLILFPELWQVGYHAPCINPEHALEPSHSFVRAFQTLAQELQVAIAITYLRHTTAGTHNHLTCFDANGQAILEYAKVHVCNFAAGFERQLAPGSAFTVAELNLAQGTIVKLGAMICMDREFPESARVLALMGAELILIPNSCPLASCEVYQDARLAGIRALAFENMVNVALTNYPAPKDDGHSCGFDYRGQAKLMAPPAAGIYFSSFDLTQTRTFREQEWLCRGEPARQVGCYGALKSE